MHYFSKSHTETIRYVRVWVDRVVSKAASGARLMRCLSGSDWGWCESLLRSTYFALVCSVLLNVSSAWGPWVSDAVWEVIERCS